MSGIYIKGMEMPSNCCECPLTYYEDGTCIFTGIEALSIGIQDACPLVPVPDHGDLIDRDALPWENQGFMLTDPDEWGLKIRDIENAPTIIPADPGGASPSPTEGAGK